MKFFIDELPGDIRCGKFSGFPEGFVHGFSGRTGGVSEGAWSSLDMGLHVGDDPQAVVENRRRFLGALGLDVNRLCTPQQVHGDHVARVSVKEAGRGAFDYADSIPQTDALITDERDLPLLLCFADCTPILFADPVHHAVGAAHGGWKGTFARIVMKTAKAMHESFGTNPNDLYAVIGPAIGPCCYEVDDKLAARFAAKFPEWQDKIIEDRGKTGHKQLDLWETNYLQLLAAGLKPEHIGRADYCTSCHHDIYFSYRADGGKTGRLAAVIAAK